MFVFGDSHVCMYENVWGKWKLNWRILYCRWASQNWNVSLHLQKKVSTQADRIIKFVLNFLSSHSFRISYQSNKTVSVYTNQRSWLVFNNVNTDQFYEDDRTNSLKKCIFLHVYLCNHWIQGLQNNPDQTFIGKTAHWKILVHRQ